VRKRRGKGPTKRQREYMEKLRDPRWQKLRLEVLDAAEWRCTWCGREDKNIQIHHGFYGRDLEPWEYPPESLHVVCEDCHLQAESIKAEVLEAFGHVPPQFQHHAFYFLQELRNALRSGEVVEALPPWRPPEEAA